MQEFRVVRMKVLLLISSAVCLVTLFVAAYKENFTAQWRDHQSDYARLLAEQAAKENKPARAYPIEVRQNYLEDWGRVDRCVNCHVGIDNPVFKNQPQPLAAHSGDLLKSHPPDRFGCTVCHQGQGRATDKAAAHGRVPYWDEPLLTGDFVQTTCTKCHHENSVPEAPALNHGRRLLVDLGCVGCHQTGSIRATEKAGPRLTAIGSKVSRKWLNKWLANPQGYLPHAKMPHYKLNAVEVAALAAYLMTFRDKSIDSMPEPKGNFDAGGNVYREGQCIVCHVTKVDYAENPVGGTIGPDLRKIGNKANPRWLVAFFQNPHAFVPHTKMPRYNVSPQQAADLAQFAAEDWTDYDLLDAEEKEPEAPPATPDQIALGKRLFAELDCAGCHDLQANDKKPNDPDLTYIGSRSPHQLTYGDAQIRHTLPDFLFAKLKAPRSLHHALRLPSNEDPSVVLWRSLRPAALFTGVGSLPDAPKIERLKWVFQRAQQAGVLAANLQIPEGNWKVQGEWLAGVLNESGALNSLKMPDFQLNDRDAEALTIALMSLSDVSPPSKRYEVQAVAKAIFNPQDNFGQLERRYRCTSCHSIRDSGDLLASDLTWEGSRVQREWLYHYLNKPYSMRRTITIAMPIFHFPDNELRFMADYMSQVFADVDIGVGWKAGHKRADRVRGKQLFKNKGCIACHQLHGKGGDVGPSLTTQVPEFPVGTWVGDKLRPEWIYQWLKNPQALLPNTIDPNLGLSEQELLDLTAYLSNLKNPEAQQKEQQGENAKQ